MLDIGGLLLDFKFAVIMINLLVVVIGLSFVICCLCGSWCWWIVGLVGLLWLR